MHPLFHVGAWRISSYLALHWVGIALGAILGWRELRRAQLGAAQAGATLLALVIAAHLGAHAYHVLTNPAHYLAGGGDWHDCVTNGLALNGGILGAYVGLLAAARVLRVESWRLADALAPGGALALGVFRIGCWAEGACAPAAPGTASTASPTSAIPIRGASVPRERLGLATSRGSRSRSRAHPRHEGRRANRPRLARRRPITQAGRAQGPRSALMYASGAPPERSCWVRLSARAGSRRPSMSSRK